MNTGKSPRGEHRSSPLWGTGNRGGDSRSNALWGKGGRGLVTALVAVLVVGAPLAAADRKEEEKKKNRIIQVAPTTYIDPILLAKAQMQPDELVKVIIQANQMNRAKRAFRDADDEAGERGGDLETQR